MSERVQYELSRLRKIGWEYWDPIGLVGESWSNDEYDAYLLQAFGRLWNGANTEEVADYLANVETEHMGLSEAADLEQRSRAAASALAAYVFELRDPD